MPDEGNLETFVVVIPFGEVPMRGFSVRDIATQTSENSNNEIITGQRAGIPR